jgi:hypothetical protein
MPGQEPEKWFLIHHVPPAFFFLLAGSIAPATMITILNNEGASAASFATTGPPYE